MTASRKRSDLVFRFGGFGALALLGSSAALGASPAVCVLDGGGSVNDRACGAERAISDISQTYSAMGDKANFQLLVGTGQNGQPSCTTALGTCGQGNCRTAGSDSWNNATGAYDRLGATTQVNLNLKNAPGPLYAGTSDSFDQNCFFNSAKPPQGKVPVCNLWTTNHGAPEGVTFAQTDPSAKDQYLNADRLRSKADGCGTFKYVTDSCYGAQLGDVIYDKDKHVVPGRCGMAAAPKGYQAPGAAAADMNAGGQHFQVKSVEQNASGRDVAHSSDSVPMQIYYPMIENVANDAAVAKKKHSLPPSLDDLQASALLDDAFQAPGQENAKATMLPGLVPTLSSDIYLGDALGETQANGQSTHSTMLAPAEADRAALVKKALKPDLNAQVTGIIDCIPNTNSPGPAIDALVAKLAPALHMSSDSSTFDDDEKAEMMFDLKSEAAKVAGFKNMNCKSNALGAAIAAAYGQHGDFSTCDFESNYDKFVKERDARLGEYTTAQQAAVDARTQLNAQCASAGVTPCADLSTLDKRLRIAFRNDCPSTGSNSAVLKVSVDADATLSGSCPGAYEKVKPLLEMRNALLHKRADTLAAEKQAAQDATYFEDFLNVHSQERHYEALKLRMAQVIDFYEHADPSKVRDYLALRRCELGDFDKAAPATWADLKAQRHIATTN